MIKDKYLTVPWLAQLSNNTFIQVPFSTGQDTNIRKHNVVALMRRLIPTQAFLHALANKLTVTKFININTLQEIPFQGTHASFPEVFAFHNKDKFKILHQTIHHYPGDICKSNWHPLDFEDNLITPITNILNPLNITKYNIISKTQFSAIIIHPDTNDEILTEYHFKFE